MPKYTLPCLAEEITKVVNYVYPDPQTIISSVYRLATSPDPDAEHEARIEITTAGMRLKALADLILGTLGDHQLVLVDASDPLTSKMAARGAPKFRPKGCRP